MKSYSHYDFISATPLGRVRSDFTRKQPFPVSYASEYGFSKVQVPINGSVKEAYTLFGASEEAFPQNLEINRFHATWGIKDRMDLGISYLIETTSKVSGWGSAFKYVLYRGETFFLSSRAIYSTAEKKDLFKITSYATDLSASLNFNRIDFYAGAKYSAGSVQFTSSNELFAFDDIQTQLDINNPEYFYGFTFALSKKIRTTMQWNKIGDEYAIIGKISIKTPTFIPMLPVEKWGSRTHY